MKPIRVICTGNAFAGDDAIGPMMAKKLDFSQSNEVEIIDAGASGLNLLSLMEEAKAVILIDGISSGHRPGIIHRLEIPQDLPILKSHSWSSGSSSTHSFGLAESLTLGATLGTLPSIVLVLGIEIQNTGMGEYPSPDVIRAMDSLATSIHREIDAVTCMNSNS